MGLFEIKVKVPPQQSGGGVNLTPLVDATKEVAKSNDKATAHSDARHTDNRQISAEERYGLINIWQEIFHHIGIWSVEQIQRTGIKLNDGKYNYMLLDHYHQEFHPEREQGWVMTHYLAHVSAADPLLKERLMENNTARIIGGYDLLETIDLAEFKQKRLPKMSLGWVELS